MDIKGCTVLDVSIDEFGKPYAFEIEDQAGKSMFLAADSAEAQDAWRQQLVFGATGKQPQQVDGLIAQRRRTELSKLKATKATKNVAKVVSAVRAFQTVKLSSDPQAVAAAAAFKAKLTKAGSAPSAPSSRAPSLTTPSGAAAAGAGGGSGASTPTAPSGAGGASGSPSVAAGSGSGDQIQMELQGMPEVGTEIRVLAMEGGLRDVSLAWFTFSGDTAALPSYGTVSPPPAGVALIEGATGEAYTLTAAEVGKHVGVIARSALGKSGSLAVSSSAVVSVDDSVTAARVLLVPHEHNRYCDRRVRVCTALGRFREYEVLKAHIRGPPESAKQYKVRWWHSDPLPEGVSASGNVQALLQGTNFRIVQPRQVSDLPPSPPDSDPAPDIAVVKQKLALDGSQEWAVPAAGVFEYPLFPEDVGRMIAFDLVPLAGPEPPLPPVVGEVWPLWAQGGSLAGKAGADSSNALEGGRICSLPVGPVLPGPPKAREIWIEGDQRVGQVLWGRFWYFGGRMGPCKVWWVRIDAEGESTDLIPPTALPEHYWPRNSFADAAQMAPPASEPGVAKGDPCILRLGPKDQDCVFKFKVLPVRSDGDEGHAESSRPCADITAAGAPMKPTRFSTADELTAEPMARRVTTSAGKLAPPAPEGGKKPPAAPSRGDESPSPGGGSPQQAPPAAAPSPLAAPAAAPPSPPSAAAAEDDPDALLAGWAELADGDGNVYYFNEATEESRWTKPTAEMLPDGWVRMTDDEGAAYYFNTYTGESQWDKPTE